MFFEILRRKVIAMVIDARPRIWDPSSFSLISQQPLTVREAAASIADGATRRLKSDDSLQAWIRRCV
jgi:hypothetical protein